MVGFRSILDISLDIYIKARSTQTETSLLKQYVAGERVDLLDEKPVCRESLTSQGNPVHFNVSSMDAPYSDFALCPLHP